MLNRSVVYDGLLAPQHPEDVMFERSNVPPEMSQTVVDGLNNLIQRLRAMKVDSITVAGPHSGSWYRNLINVYTQAHIRRLLSFLDAGHAELLANRPLVTEMCSRAIYETVACYCDFVAGLCPLLDANDVDKMDEFIRTRTFASRIPSFLKEDSSVSATNILTQIDKLDKINPSTRAAYDHLSDIVHPNALGSVIYFSEMRSDGTMAFPEETSSTGRARHSLATSALMMLHFDMALHEVEPRLEKLKTNPPSD
jgi:hypothetical protein